MEDELHEMIRNLVGKGEWTPECTKLWDRIEATIKSRVEMLESANSGWQRHAAELEKQIAARK